MASAVFYTSMNLAPALFSRTHFLNSIPKDFSDVFLHTHHVNYYLPARKIGSLKRLTSKVKAAVTEVPLVNQSGGENLSEGKKKLKILVAGGGIGGLVFALAARRKGFEVVVFERDLSAIRGEGQYRGPIQIQSNALAALEAIDWDVADEVMKAGCITGDRINGLVDGVSGNWYLFFSFNFFLCR